MAGWKRTAVGLGGIIAIMAAFGTVFTLSAPAQQSSKQSEHNSQPSQQNSQPNLLPFVPENPTNPKPEELPSITFDDANVQPAAYNVPGYPVAGTGAAAYPVADPPAPVVRIQVRVAADSAIGDDLKYIITVQNTSTADAHAVTVRNPLSDVILQAVKAEPEWDKTRSVLTENAKKQLVWYFGTLPAGRSKTIELTLRPKPDATDVKNLAYVQFEHGEAVTTRLSKPQVKVSKTASKQAIQDEPYLVRVLLENTGKVIAENIRVTENVPAASEFEAVTRGAKRTTQPTGQQWVWEIAKLMPGERKMIEFKVTARSENEALTLTNVSGAKGIEERAEARTKVLVPGISIKMTGPTGVVNPGESAKYEITVRNTGTLPSTNVKVTGTIPGDCKPTMKTDGGQVFRDVVQWIIPRLEPSEAQSFRFGLKAATSGRRMIVASVTDARGQRAGDELATVFQGAAALAWESSPNPPALSVGGQGTFTVKIRNNGGEAARNVQLEVDVDRPEAATVTQVVPNIRFNPGKLVFNPEVIPAFGEINYTITFTAKQSAQVWFKLKMTADCLADHPMQTEKAVEITGGVK
ncbi:MAG TPA: hypothetical protein VG097_11240 [Gemmata sp.]|jgi:uncharacterized repeat protein (TIGR01451 family)|nr:hypothetical protein [Gemmata sp.]